MDNDSIGVDISKDHLDVHAFTPGTTARFSNTPAGFRALTRWLGPTALARVVYEPTGPYHRAFEAYFETRLPLVQVNPLQARRFAQGRGCPGQDRPDRRCGFGADGGGAAPAA